MPTTTHCAPNRSLKASIRSGSDSAGEFTEIFSAPASRTASASATERMPPATQKGMSSTPRDAADPGAVDGAAVRARGDVVEHELVRALVAVARGEFEDVADHPVVAEAHALDDLAVADVEAGDYAFGKNARNSSIGMQLFEQRLAADRRRRARRRRAPRGPRASRTPPEACHSMPREARATASRYRSTFGPARRRRARTSVHSTCASETARERRPRPTAINCDAAASRASRRTARRARPGARRRRA